MALHDLLDLELTVPEPDALMAFWERLGMVRSDQHVAWRSRGPSDEPDAVLRGALAELSGHPTGS